MRCACLPCFVAALVSTGCRSAQDAPGSIILNIRYVAGLELETRLDEACALVCTTTAGWPDGPPRRQTYMLPADAERFRLLWQRLRKLPPPTPAECGSYQIILETSGARIAEFVFDNDAERFPFWYGVLRELQVAARADVAYALAYREIAEYFARHGEWLMASGFCLRALDAAEAGRQVQFAVELQGGINDVELFTSETRSLRFSGMHEETVRAFRTAWGSVIAPWISVAQRGDVVEVTVDGQAPVCAE